LIYEIDQRKKLNILDDFENKTLTHIGATHAILKIERKSQIRIPRELYQKFCIPRNSRLESARFIESVSLFGNKKNRTLKKLC